MPSRTSKVIVNFGGGWATDYGPSFSASPSGNAITLPFLLTAENVAYALDGSPYKIGGALKFNSTQVTETGSPVTFEGLFDYWKQGTTFTESQHLVAVVGTKYMYATHSSPTWTEIVGSKETGKEPCFEVFNDDLIIATDSTTDVPYVWDQSAGAILGGTPPRFSFMVRHRNHIFAAGVHTLPSRLYWCKPGDHEDWTHATAGSIDIDPQDGDRIVGIASHKNELLVFKGPNRLSIHRITGSSSSDFARSTFVQGVGGINHNSIIRVNDDVVFASPRGIHSLAATAAYGNYIEAFLTHPILTHYQDNLDHTVLRKMRAVNYQRRGQAIFAVAPSGSGSHKTEYLVYDYRFQPGRWARWRNFGPFTSSVGSNPVSLATIQTTARQHKLYIGSNDGYVREMDRNDRGVDAATAYTALVETPYLNFGSSGIRKNAEQLYISMERVGTEDITFGYSLDGNAEQTVLVDQAGGATLT